MDPGLVVMFSDEAMLREAISKSWCGAITRKGGYNPRNDERLVSVLSLSTPPVLWRS